MIKILDGKEKYIVDNDFNITGKDKEYKEFLKATIDCIIMDYDLSKSFITSYVAYRLEQMKFDVLEVIDEEMEKAKEGTIY